MKDRTGWCFEARWKDIFLICVLFVMASLSEDHGSINMPNQMTAGNVSTSCQGQDEEVWPVVAAEGKGPLTVIWSPSADATEHDWVHDWLLAKVRRPIITVMDTLCPPALGFGVMPDPKGGKSRTAPTDVLWVIHGSGTPTALQCFTRIIQNEVNNNKVRIGLLHLSDEFVSGPLKCNDTVTSWCSSAFSSLYSMPEVSYVFRNYWSPEFVSTGAHDAWKNKIKWIPLGITRGFGRPNDNSLLPASQRKWSCMFTGSASMLSMSPRQRFLDLLPQLNLTKRYGCFISAGTTWGGGFNKQEYRHMLQDTALVFCPGGNFAYDTFRVWEALAAGAVPIIEKGNAYDWEALPSDNPLVFIEKWEDIHTLFGQLGTRRKVDAKQKEIYSWWKKYLRQLERMVADVIG